MADDEDTRYLGTIADISALVAVLGIWIYVLGLFALFVPITNYTHDFASAWYAASLANRTMVAGQGAREVIGWPLVVLCAALLGMLAHQYLFRHFGYIGHALFLYGGLAIMFSLLAYAGYISFVTPLEASLSSGKPFWIESARTEHLRGSPLLSISIAVAAFYGLVGIRRDRDSPQVMSSLVGIQYSRERSWPSIPGRRAFILFLGYLLIGMFVGGVLGASSVASPPLPPVEITAANEIKGVLLAHTEGYWYILEPHKICKKGYYCVQQGELVAVPDGEVKAVRVLSNNDRARALLPER